MKYDFWIVAIGSSAGGLNPLKEILSLLPVNANAGFVLVSHLWAGSTSNLNIILSKHSQLPIVKAYHGLKLNRNTIYVIPENQMMTVENGELTLRLRRTDEIINNSINIFFTSLAHDAGEKALGVILSGGGQDGLLGAREIHRCNGNIIVQDPKTAEFPSMPNAVINDDHPKGIYSIKGIAEKISEITQDKVISSYQTG
jgi:two-component system chemotaxis response regulator CheB